MSLLGTQECDHGAGCPIHDPQVVAETPAMHCDRCMSFLAPDCRPGHDCKHGNWCVLDEVDSGPRCEKCAREWVGRGAPQLEGFVRCGVRGWGMTCLRRKGHDVHRPPTRHAANHGAEWGP